MAKRFTHRLAEDDVQTLQAHERHNLHALTGTAGQPPASQAIALETIARDGGTQPRVGLDEDTVAEYTERMHWDELEGAVVDPDLRRWEPVTLFFDGTTHWLADGFHRTAAAKRAQISHIQALVHHGSQRDAIAHSLGANATHGKRRTNQDKRRAVARALEDDQWKAHSDREIARMCKVSQPFVSKLRSELEHAGALAPALTRRGADGKTVEVGVMRQNRGAEASTTPGHSPAGLAHLYDLRGKTAPKTWLSMAQRAKECPHSFLVLYHTPSWIHLAMVNQDLDLTHTSSLCFLRKEEGFATIWQPRNRAHTLAAAYDHADALTVLFDVSKGDKAT